MTALQLVIQYGRTEVAKRLLEGGIDANITSRKGTSALFIAVQHDNISIIPSLLEHGADPNLGTALGISPLMLASVKGNLEMFKSLALISSTVVSFQSGRGVSTLMRASMKGNLPMAEFLLGQGANPNLLAAGNTTVLTLAAQKRYGEIVEKLLPLTKDPFFAAGGERMLSIGLLKTLTASSINPRGVPPIFLSMKKRRNER